MIRRALYRFQDQVDKEMENFYDAVENAEDEEERLFGVRRRRHSEDDDEEGYESDHQESLNDSEVDESDEHQGSTHNDNDDGIDSDGSEDEDSPRVVVRRALCGLRCYRFQS